MKSTRTPLLAGFGLFGVLAPLGSTWAAQSSDMPRGPAPPLVLVVDYSSDEIEGGTTSSATVTLLLTDGDDVAKGEAEVTADTGGSFAVECADWAGGACPDLLPGDRLFASVPGAEAAIDPIGAFLDGAIDFAADVVAATLFVEGETDPLDVRCVVEEPAGGGSWLTVPSVDPEGERFECDFTGIFDLIPGGTFHLEYGEPDGDVVGTRLEDPWARVDTTNDQVGVNYPAGHRVEVSATDSGGSLKAKATSSTEFSGGWGWEGFSSVTWVYEPPQLMGGDHALFSSDDGWERDVRVGLIDGLVDAAGDSVSGAILAPWLGSATLEVECHPWGAWAAGFPDVPILFSSASADGITPYSCDWSGVGADILPGWDIAVMYVEADGDRIVTVFREPAAHLVLGLEAQGAASASGNFELSVTLRNVGGADADNVSLSLSLGGLAYLSDTSGLAHSGSGAGPIDWSFGTVSAGTVSTFRLFVSVTADTGEGVHADAAVSTTSYDSGVPSDWSASWSGTVQANDADLRLLKSARTEDPAAGQDLVYRLEVCNLGTTASGLVELHDTLPVAVTLDGWWSTTPGWTVASSGAHELAVNRPTLPGDGCSNVLVRVVVGASVPVGTTIQNLAGVDSINDVEPGNDDAELTLEIGAPRVDLAIEKTWAGGALVPGGELSYRLDYENSGNVSISSTIVIREVVPTGTFWDASWQVDETGETPITPTAFLPSGVEWEIPSLANGEKGRLLVRLRVLESTAPGTDLVNVAEIDPHPSETDLDDNVSEWGEVLHASGPNLRVAKRGEVGDDGQVRYEVRFENIGDQLLENVEVVDTLPPDTVWSGWWSQDLGEGRLVSFELDEGVARWSFDRLEPGELGRLELGVRLPVPDEPREVLNVATITLPVGDTSPDDNVAIAELHAGGESFLADGFESGTADAWIVTDPSHALVDAGAAHSGLYGLEVLGGSSCSAGSSTTLGHLTVTDVLYAESCHSVLAGDGFVVAPGGRAAFHAGISIVLQDGFEVASGGAFSATIDPVPIPAVFVQDDTPVAAKSYNARFFVDVFAMSGTGGDVEQLVGFDGAAVPQVRLVLRSGPTLVLQVRDQAGALHETPGVALSAGWHEVLLRWQASTGSVASLAVDGADPVVVVGFDNPAAQLDFVRWGVVNGPQGGIVGLHQDDFNSWP